MHEFALRVYYEDTDLAGIVYYANYLKFIERARSEWVRACGIHQRALKADSGIVFAVRHLSADYRAPAHFEDDLIVRTALQSIGGARLVVAQTVWRAESCLFSAEVTLVCLGPAGQPVRLPAEVRRLLGAPSDPGLR